jgi:hypothetical protein
MANRLNKAIEAAKEVLTVDVERPADEPVKFVNIRMKETEYKELSHQAVNAGITKAAYCKIASLYVAEMVKQGAFTIGAGGVIDRRDRA